MEWLKVKYKDKVKFDIPEELSKYSKCEIFLEGCKSSAWHVEGVEIVVMEREELVLSDCENLLARGRSNVFCVMQ